MEEPEKPPLSETEIKKVIEIATEATRKRPPIPVATPFEKKLERVRNSVISNAFLAFLLMIVLAVLAYYSRSDALVNTMSVIGLASMVLVMTFHVLVILSGAQLFIELRKDKYAPFLRALSATCEFHLPYVIQLQQCDKQAVQYVLSQYKYEKTGFERRSSLFAGSIERVGLFPAIGALIILANALSNINWIKGISEMIPPLILAFYFLGLWAFDMIQQKDRVIGLLEYVVQSQ